MSESVAVSNSTLNQYTTFFLGDRIYGIDVMQVQEITKPMKLTKVPLAPKFVMGLINLRGQIATAISFREILGMEQIDFYDCMNAVCNIDGVLVSFVVDRVGDVVELSASEMTSVPDTVPAQSAKYLEGVYKIPGQILSVIQIHKIIEDLKKQSFNV